MLPKVTEDVLFAELVGFPKMCNIVRFSREWSKINEDALFTEQGGFIFPKVNFFDSVRITELDAWSKMFEGFRRFSKMPKFSEDHKRSDE